MDVITSGCLTVYISNLIVYILKMAWSNVLTCIYSGTKLLNSYPPLKDLCHGKLCLQVTTMWHEYSVIRIFPLNRTLIHEAYVKAGLLITWISRSASQKKLMGICMHFLDDTIACTIMSAECLCCWYIDLLQCAGEWAASKTFCQQDKGFPDSRVIPDIAFHNHSFSNSSNVW